MARQVAVARDALWHLLTDWERQPEWMVDAKAVEVLTPHREGVGVVLRCPTRVLGATVQDVMRVTLWEPPGRLDVLHLGHVIAGSGRFELFGLGPARSRIRWIEEVDPPLGRLGEWGASALGLPLLRRVFGRSLAGLAGLAEREAGYGGVSAAT